MFNDSVTMRLTDGTPVLVRPWREDDENRLSGTLRKMSWPLAYLSFFAPALPLFDEDQELPFEPSDQVWVAQELAESDEPLVAMGQLIQLEEPLLGEIDVAVEKPYQRRGLGRLLTATLYSLAQMEDLRKVHVIVQSENEKAIDWLKRLGASEEYFRDDVVDLDWPVYSKASLFPANDSSRQFQAALGEIKEGWVRTE